MIFSPNTTTLGVSNIPIDETYAVPYGANLALVESARNDMAMFTAMIQADHKEMAICRESTGYVQEGEIAALHEAVGGGIFKKIAELFKKLIAKIKSIFHNFMARIASLSKDTKAMVKKYRKELTLKSNLGKLEVKWRKINTSLADKVLTFTVSEEFGQAKAVSNYKDEYSDRIKEYMSDGVKEDSIDDYKKEKINKILDSEETLELKDIGGISHVMTWLDNYDAKLKTMNKNIKDAESKLNKVVDYYSKKVDKVAGASFAKEDKDKTYSGTDAYGNEDKVDNIGQDQVNDAKKQYEMAQAYNDVITADIGVCQE